MLTKITIRNFKVFGDEVEIPLDNGVVFIGPNNAGKTSALQALALWHAGLQKWTDKYSAAEVPAKRPGVTVNRLELIPLPVSEMNLIWHRRKVRSGPSENIRIELIVEGYSEGQPWKCGLEFDYDNVDALFCRPLRMDGKAEKRMSVPAEAKMINLAFLPSMSGLASEEDLLKEGSVNVKIGQGRTAEVLRNLCYRVYEEERDNWKIILEHIEKLFGVQLEPPEFRHNRGDIVMEYTEQGSKVKFDLPSSGRGMQQTLLLLAYLYANRSGTTLLLDEPDAHLEILRQKQIYQRIVEAADSRQSQIIAASHSEVLLNEAAQRDAVIAFIGKPHKMIESKKSEVLKALREIGFENYYKAKIKGWVLYLESDTDLKILREFAKKLNHQVETYLQDPFIHYLGNDVPQGGRRHFHAVKEAKEDLTGFLLVDKMDKELQKEPQLKEMMWKKREIENYLCKKEALMSFAVEGLNDDLFGHSQKGKREEIMQEEIGILTESLRNLYKELPFTDDIKASDDFLVPLFKKFSEKLIDDGGALALRKSDFYKLVKYFPKKR